MHDGLYDKNPKVLSSLEALQESAHKKGAVFVVRKKEDFQAGVKGFIVTSKEALRAQAHKLSHFTPNIYRQFGYTDDSRKKIKGFEEKNLLQINAFVIDIDTKRSGVNDLLLACIDDSIGEPTLILETDRGYQIFFVLATPIYISNNKNYLSLTVAKRIADNLKRSLRAVEPDIHCNDFGFFRMPNAQNIVWFNEQATYAPAQLIAWSERQDDDLDRPLYVVAKQRMPNSLLQSEWFQQLLAVTDIKGEKGQIGRNNYLFTLALICFQDGKDKVFAYDLLDQFNARTQWPLESRDIAKIVESAYSGRYHGAKKEYVQQLLELYDCHRPGTSICFGKKVWRKHKKKREDRKNSHMHEWEKDIMNWITAEKDVSEPFLWRSQKELCAAVGMASSTLNQLLKHSKKLMKKVMGKGRNAKTGWTTVEQYMAHLIWLKKQTGQPLYDLIQHIVPTDLRQMKQQAAHPVLYRAIKQERKSTQLTLFTWNS